MHVCPIYSADSNIYLLILFAYVKHTVEQVFCLFDRSRANSRYSTSRWPLLRGVFLLRTALVASCDIDNYSLSQLSGATTGLFQDYIGIQYVISGHCKVMKKGVGSSEMFWLWAVPSGWILSGLCTERALSLWLTLMFSRRLRWWGYCTLNELSDT